MTTGRVSVVVPCRNEERHIANLLAALERQAHPPDEIIVVDGASSDRTREVVEGYRRQTARVPIQLLDGPPGVIPASLNVGVRAAAGDIVVRFDGHSYPGVEYIERALKALDDPAVGVVGGIWRIAADAQTTLSQAIALAVAHPLGAGDASYRIARPTSGLRAVDTVPFGCFRRQLWERLGGFNERLRVSEDYEFNYRVRAAGLTVLLDTSMHSTYFARGTLQALVKQYFGYGWWKAQVVRLHPDSRRWRQWIPAALVASSGGSALAAAAFPPALVGLAVIALLYGSALAAGTIHVAITTHAWRTAFVLPVVFAAIHLSQGSGFLLNVLTAGRFPYGSDLTEVRRKNL